MLLELRIGNLALAEDVVLRPGPGLTVLTGETGAGKSLIAGALELLTGGRADRGLVRLGEDVAWVEAVCDLSGRADLQQDLARVGVRCYAEDGLLVMRREIRREGRGRVLFNGEISSLAVLERVGDRLFTIQSQHQQQDLRSPHFARELLDTVLELGDRRDRAARALASFQSAQAELNRRRQENELALQQFEIWRDHFTELDGAALRPDEEKELAEAIAVKRHARAMQDAAGSALSRLVEGEAPVRESLGAAAAALTAHAERSQRLAAALQSLQVAGDLTADAASELERFLDSFQVDPRGLAELEARKALYESLRRKHRRDVTGLLALRQELAGLLARQEQAGRDLDTLTVSLQAARDELATACLALHDARREGALAVAAAAETAIRPLALPTLELAFQVDRQFDPEGQIELDGRRCRAAAHGADDVRLLVRTNPGENVGEVAAIASGGEAARIYLGLTLLAKRAQRPLVRLFDEVDAGLGMDAATPVAWLLRDLARGVQAICITHLPTVSVHGGQHWRVTKRVLDGRTTVSLAPVTGNDRVQEVARQLGGEGWQRGDAAAQIHYARDLLAAAGTG
ncbi:MAG: hypothetical protein RBT60_11740 [Candidatus Krumholzibacteria bacterium]|jgi:DNA repair protein RecN (Recombination protein N)|nr:hypothetical protein [Candidatus Krumholzibacteria bacterium]